MAYISGGQIRVKGQAARRGSTVQIPLFLFLSKMSTVNESMNLFPTEYLFLKGELHHLAIPARV